MITASLTGNLGNHMFQYALTRTVAELNGYDWGFNPRTSHDYHNGRPQMDFMNIDYGQIHDARWGEYPKGVDKEFREFSISRGVSDTYYPFDMRIFSVKDGTKLVIPCGQNAAYYDKEELLKWFEINSDAERTFSDHLIYLGITLDKDTVVLNVRGGEYRGIKDLILPAEYWYNAMAIMKFRNENSRFICVTDDVSYAAGMFNGDVPVYHTNIGCDYYIVNNAHNLILSNSSFAIFPTWLNQNDPFVIAPRYWARHNVSNGNWISSDIWTFGWNFLDKDGKLYDK